jgi:hypothetical protein
MLATLVTPAAASAQVLPQLPASYAAPNYDRIFVGVVEAHEAGAYMARTRGPAANWYGVAGLAQDETAAVSGNARGLELSVLSGKAPGQQDAQLSSFDTLPQFIGVSLGPDGLPWKGVHGGISFMKKNAWASLVWWGEGNSAGHWSYVSDSSFGAYEVSAGAAWALTPELRLGANLALSWSRLYDNSTFTQLLSETGDAPATMRSRLVSGIVFDVTPTLAVQWTPRPWLALGAVVRSAGLRVGGGATVRVEELNTSAAGSANVSMQDFDATYELRDPLRIGGAVALLFRGWAVELDVRYHASPGTYAMISSNQPIRTVTTPPGGTATEAPFPDVLFVGRAVVDFALGGSYALNETVKLHGGLYNSASPVSQDSAFLRQMDIYGARGGVSFRGEHLSGSAGLGLERTVSNATPGLILPGVGAIDDSIEVTTLSAVVGLEYRF